MGFGLLSIAPANAGAIVTANVTITEAGKFGECLTQTEAATKVSTTPRVFQVGGGIKIGSVTGDSGFFDISGPAKFTGGTGTFTISGDQTRFSIGAASDVANLGFTGVGAVSVAIKATSAGAALHTYYFSVVSACAVDSFSATTSFITTNSSGTTGAAAATNVDANTSATAGGNLFIIIAGKNAYGTTLTTGTYAASATNGALLSWGPRGTLQAAGVVSSAILNPPTGDDQLRVTPASTALGATTTVTITHNGTTVATKTLTFHAEAASIVIDDTYSGTVGTTGAASTGYIKYSYKSAAGAVVPSTASALVAASQTAIVPAMTQGKAPTSSAAAVTGIAAAQIADIGSTTSGVLGFDCAKTGTSTVTIATVNTVTGATITSPVTVSCTTGIDTYTVSTDKAAYRVGEVATITITAKDSTGNLVSDATDMTSGVVSVGGGSLTKAVVAGDLFRKGVITYRAQMTTAGAFNTVVTLPGTTKSVTAAYTVTDGGVSNAEVLKSIVSLIASINKQIQALQKLILRR